MKIGVISDTHDYFHPQLPELFAGVDHILHAGDVGKAVILLQLQEIAPVTAVLGNTDAFLPLKETEIVSLGGRKFLVHHIVNPHQQPNGSLATTKTRQRPDVVVFGHTHKCFNQVIDGVLYFNPGYAGNKPVERSVAILHVDSGKIRPKFLPLPAEHADE